MLGGASSSPRPRNPRSASESAVRQAMPRSESCLRSSRSEQPEVRARRQAGAADLRGVERCTLCFNERVEVVRVEHLVQPVIERMPTVAGRSVVAIHNAGRSRLIGPSTHCHARHSTHDDRFWLMIDKSMPLTTDC